LITIVLTAVVAGTYALALSRLSQRLCFGTSYASFWKTTCNLLSYLFWGIGFSQLIYIIPLVLWLRKRRQFERMKGVIIAAALIGLFCGGCFVAVFPGFSRACHQLSQMTEAAR
jgi:hypothetical protein